MSELTEARIVEYNALRQEMLTIQEGQRNLFFFTFSAIGAITSFAFQQKNPMIMMISFVILLISTCFYYNFSIAIIQRATYIKVFLEAEIKGLHWETTLSDGRKSIKLNKPIYRRLTDYLFTLFCVLLYGLFFYILYILFENAKDLPSFVMILLTLSPILILFSLIYLDYNNTAKKMTEKYLNCENSWEDTKKQYKSISDRAKILSTR